MIYNPLDEKWRWCVYCNADCWPEVPPHAKDCPLVTGLYPVDEDMLTNEVRCGCGYVFQHGDLYVETEVTKIGPDTHCVVACIGCGAEEAGGSAA